MLQTADGAQHILFKDSGHCVQMHVRGADVTEPVHLLMDIIPRHGVLKFQLRALESFNNLITGQTSRQKHIAAEPSSQRLCAALRVLDARLAGASYRDIAVALFGLGRVKEDWNAPDEHLKNRIRRAAKRGMFLVEGGYRTLLR